jgi:hypothetical protein
LFMDRASAVAPRIEWNDQTKVHVGRICRLLDGIPLAIELAAARTRVLSAEEIADRLGDRFRLLTGGSRSALPRQQTLEAAVDWSYQLLSTQERRLFERLAVFVGGFTLEAIEAVCTDEEVDRVDVLDLLTGLVDKSMVIAESGESGGTRYRLLETLRQFGVRLLAATNEMEQLEGPAPFVLPGVARKHGRSSLGTRSGPAPVCRRTGKPGGCPRVGEDGVEVVGSAHRHPLSIHHFFSLGDPETALSLVDEALENPRRTRCASKEPGSVFSVHWGESMTLWPVGRGWKPCWKAADDDDAAWCLARVASVFAWAPELDVSRAVPLAEAAIARSKNLGPEARFVTQMALGSASMWSNVHPREVVPVFREAADQARSLGNLRWRLWALSFLAVETLALDQQEGTDLTTPVEDEMFEIWETSGRSVQNEYVAWTAMRRGMWGIAEEQLTLLDPESGEHCASRC